MLTGPSVQIGATQAMSGKHGGAAALPALLPGGYSPPYAACFPPRSPTTSLPPFSDPAPILPSSLPPPLPLSISVCARFIRLASETSLNDEGFVDHDDDIFVQDVLYSVDKFHGDFHYKAEA
jgi:hypothetical protein